MAEEQFLDLTEDVSASYEVIKTMTLQALMIGPFNFPMANFAIYIHFKKKWDVGGSTPIARESSSPIPDEAQDTADRYHFRLHGHEVSRLLTNYGAHLDRFMVLGDQAAFLEQAAARASV